ncbi:prolyl oligopeptidase family serine peptidase, partial [Streptococcus pyogenes]|uniref:prolyl oligopeptidase family serine peptidase n=1 Tax=Streptococcus pyogenes TaxID=1314 RepID=UPI003D9FCB60
MVDYVTRTWREGRAVDSERIGAFGFSAGGYAVLTAAGARPVFSRLPGHCHENRQDHLCSALLPRWDSMKDLNAPQPDGRIKAAVVAAPALGHLFEENSLRDLRVQLQ